MESLAAFSSLSFVSIVYLFMKQSSNSRSKIVGKRLKSRISLNELPETKNISLLLAAKGKETDTAPVWVMRQAGRYLPEFRAMRKIHDFFSLCQNPELATEVTLQPLKRFKDLDAVIVFSDILVIPQAMGMEVLMIKGRGPVFPNPLRQTSDVNTLDLKLTLSETELDNQLGYVFDVVNLTRQEVKGSVPVIGFSGGPFTLLCYMIEGGSSRNFEKTKSWYLNNLDSFKELLRRLTIIIIDYCEQKALAGAQLLQIFESSACQLPSNRFFELSFPYLRDISIELRKRLGNNYPLTVFARGANEEDVLERLEKETEYDVIQVDWKIKPSEARKRVINKTIQGNFDPCNLFAAKDKIDEAVKEMIEGFNGKDDYRYIANLGHGMLPSHDPTHLEAFFKAVKKHTKR